ncbi:hypothetical protein MRB53_017957 [Persea americana]|uniref:Uncharacterized protein n=1 Tax=Persea americana TaxID=3435 RepID=A0ACC2M734_PERAE|nr:hypothetical protein MRB53_017957 [Persea americana]
MAQTSFAFFLQQRHSAGDICGDEQPLLRRRRLKRRKPQRRPSFRSSLSSTEATSGDSSSGHLISGRTLDHLSTSIFVFYSATVIFRIIQILYYFWKNKALYCNKSKPVTSF